MLRSVITTALLVGAASFTLAAPAAADPLMGVYKGAGCDGAGRLPRYEGIMGRKLDGVTDFFSSDSWDSLMSGATWALGCWQGKPYKLTLGVPLVVKGGTLAQVAAGQYDDQFSKLGALLVAKGQANATLRLGWEFNGDWFHWGVKTGDEGAFKSCWIRWYGILKHTSSKFLLVWNPNNQSTDSKLDVRDFWPGTKYVDAAGPDAYALSRGGKLISPSATGPNGEPLGIAAWASWVASKGVPLAVPEWAIRDVAGWGSTSPTYIDEMRAAFVTAAASKTGLAYESYFDGGEDYKCQFSIHDSACGAVHTAAAARYKTLWSKPYSPAAAKL